MPVILSVLGGQRKKLFYAGVMFDFNISKKQYEGKEACRWG